MTIVHFVQNMPAPGGGNARTGEGQAAADGLVPTTTLLPSGAVVTARIQGLADGRFVVSDDGSSIDEVSTQLFISPGRRELRLGEEIAKRLGLKFDALGFRTEGVQAEQLEAAVIYVAEAARQWSSQLIDLALSRRGRDLTEVVEERLKRVLPSSAISREREVYGLSNRSYRFDLAAELGGERLALFELVSPHPNAIAAAHLKFFDVGGSHPDWPREAVVERLSAWASTDLAVLGRVTTHVRDFETDWGDLAKLAA